MKPPTELPAAATEPAQDVAPMTEETTEAPEAPVSFFKNMLGFGGEMLHVVVISLAIILPVRWFLIQPFYVKGASMEPTFEDHEYLIIDELSYRLGDITRGDVVVFHYPNDPKQFFIKRVIGLPGERVIVESGGVSVYNDMHPEGVKLDETPYLHGVQTFGAKDVRLKDGEYFLLGDNRGNSLDSRIFGAVPREFIVGRVLLRGWPVSRATLFGNQSGIIGNIE